MRGTRSLAKDALPFHLYKVQFRDEATLFPSSQGIANIASFVDSVLRWSMEQKPKTPRRWVVAELYLDGNLDSTILSGQLVRLKKTRTIHFEETNLRLDTAFTDDADTLAFFLDSQNEYFLLQTSTQIADKTALGKFREFFDKADPRVRQSKLITFEPINPNEQAIERLKRERIKKIVVTVSKPNGEINRAFNDLLNPALRATNADMLAFTWESQKGRLSVADGSAIDDAVTLASQYGKWKATPYEKGARPIVSDETPSETNLPATSLQSMLRAARAYFDRLRTRLGDRA